MGEAMHEKYNKLIKIIRTKTFGCKNIVKNWKKKKEKKFKWIFVAVAVATVAVDIGVAIVAPSNIQHSLWWLTNSLFRDDFSIVCIPMTTMALIRFPSVWLDPISFRSRPVPCPTLNHISQQYNNINSMWVYWFDSNLFLLNPRRIWTTQQLDLSGDENFFRYFFLSMTRIASLRRRWSSRMLSSLSLSLVVGCRCHRQFLIRHQSMDGWVVCFLVTVVFFLSSFSELSISISF